LASDKVRAAQANEDPKGPQAKGERTTATNVLTLTGGTAAGVMSSPAASSNVRPQTAETRAIEAARNGDGSAFEVLYNLHKRRVYSLCLRMVNDAAEAEDLTQEAFLQLFRKIGTFRGESAFSTWLHRLTVNLVLMRLRKKGLWTMSLDDTGNDPDDSRPMEIGTADNALTGSVDRITLDRAIGSLPPGYRLVFQLHDVEGYEHQEIATMVGCSVGNSKSQLHKARMKLRDLLQMESSGIKPGQAS
jgi:RNA polymerase sigma-70 factor (ECF subfamily)